LRDYNHWLEADSEKRLATVRGPPMRRPISLNFLVQTLLVLTSLLTAQVALAESDCIKGFRDTTDAERARMTTALELLRNALPAAPEGWVIKGDDQFSALRRVCMDSTIWTYGHTRYYQRVDDQAEQEARMQAAAVAMKADIAAKQSRLDANMAKRNELSKQYAAAAQAGDTARAAELWNELDVVGKEYEAIFAEGETLADTSADIEQAGLDHIFTVAAVINPLNASANSQDTIAVPAGATAAYHWQAGDPTGLATVLVLLGQWELADYGFEQTDQADPERDTPLAISVRIEAAESRLPSVTGAIDFSGLAGLLQD
jgi:hypothetical protein